MNFGTDGVVFAKKCTKSAFEILKIKCFFGKNVYIQIGEIVLKYKYI